MTNSNNSIEPDRFEGDSDTRTNNAADSLSVDPKLVERSAEPDLEARMENADVDQFRVRYTPARKYLTDDFVLNHQNSIDTAHTYDSILNRYVDYLREKTGKSPKGAKKNEIAGFLYFLGTEYGRAESTLRSYRSVIKNLHEFSQIQDSITDPETSAAEIGGLDLGKYAAQECTFEREDISRGEVQALIDAASGPRNTLLITVLYETGIRNDDAAKLKVQNVYFDEKRIEIYDSKGGADYKVPIRSELALKIDQFIRVERDPINEDCEYLFPSNQGGHLSNSGITRIVKEAAGQAEGDIQRVLATIKSTPNQVDWFGNEKKVYRVTPHTLRHALVTHLSDNKVPKKLQKIITGHDSDVIEDYNHSDDTTAFELAREQIPH